MSLKTFLMVAILLPGAFARGEDTSQQEQDLKSLIGLPGVHVIVEGTNKDAAKLGLTEQKIRFEVELALKKAGIKLMTDDERRKLPSAPYLYINLTVMAQPNGLHPVFALRIELQQRIKLLSSNPSEVFATTWAASILGVNDAEGIKKALGDRMDVFIDAYLTANPKK